MQSRGLTSNEPDRDWLKVAQGVPSGADTAPRLVAHWRKDADLLADATASFGSLGSAPLFAVAMRDFDRLVGAL